MHIFEAKYGLLLTQGHKYIKLHKIYKNIYIHYIPGVDPEYQIFFKG